MLEGAADVSGMPDHNQTASPGGGVLAPLRLHVFRALWLANLVSATGTIVQGVGAAWLMTTLAGTPDLVAMVQTATYLPFCCWRCSPARWPTFGTDVGSCFWPSSGWY